MAVQPVQRLASILAGRHGAQAARPRTCRLLPDSRAAGQPDRSVETFGRVQRKRYSDPRRSDLSEPIGNRVGEAEGPVKRSRPRISDWLRIGAANPCGTADRTHSRAGRWRPSFPNAPSCGQLHLMSCDPDSACVPLTAGDYLSRDTTRSQFIAFMVVLLVSGSSGCVNRRGQ